MHAVPLQQTAWSRLPAAGLLWAAGLAVAGQPLATDDAGVLAERGDCEAEVYASRLRLPGVGRARTLDGQLSCGLGGDAQAALGYGHSSAPDAGSHQRHQRHEALALAAKLQLLGGGSGPGPVLALSAGSVLGRTGAAPFRFDSAYATAVLSGALAPGFTGHANLGWTHSRADHQNSSTWNLALEYSPRDGLEAGIECYGDDRQPAWLGLGLRWAVASQLKLGASYALQANSLRQRLLSLGLTLGF